MPDQSQYVPRCTFLLQTLVEIKAQNDNVYQHLKVISTKIYIKCETAK